MNPEDMRRCQEYMRDSNPTLWKCRFGPDPDYPPNVIRNPLDSRNPIPVEEFHQSIRRNHP